MSWLKRPQILSRWNWVIQALMAAEIRLGQKNSPMI